MTPSDEVWAEVVAQIIQMYVQEDRLSQGDVPLSCRNADGLQHVLAGRTTLDGYAEVRKKVPRLPQDFVSEASHRYLSQSHARFPLRPGFSELFASVAVPMAVVSNGDAPHIQELLNRWNVAKHFCAIVTPAETIGLKDELRFGATLTSGGSPVLSPKPSPSLYRCAARLLKVEPQYCIAVEDTVRGMTAAIDAGCRTFVLANDSPDLGAQIDVRRGVTLIDGADSLRSALALHGAIDVSVEQQPSPLMGGFTQLAADFL